MLCDLDTTKPDWFYGFCLEIVFYNMQMNLIECHEKVMGYRLNEQGVPHGIEIKKNNCWAVYHWSIDKHKGSICTGGRNASLPAQSIMTWLYYAGYSSAKWHKIYIDKEKDLEIEEKGLEN